MSKSVTLKDICRVAAAVSCLNAGQTFREIASSAKVSEQTVRRWVKQAGFVKLNGRWVKS